MRMTELAERLIPWYESRRRALPWRADPSPYRVWVSEIMLQQTRIEAVLPYFERFMQAFPTVEALAAAGEDRLMKLWEGLGYYSRARNLQKAARVVCATYGGQLPASYDALLALPGIGPYTAGAVASIAFGIPVPAVDGNVLRVTARLLGCDGDVLQPAVKAMLTQAVAQQLPPDRPGLFNQALMELGETVCLPNTMPACDACPLAADCAARRTGRQRELPVRGTKKARRVERRTVLVLIAGTGEKQVLLHKRPPRGLLAGMWELPNAEGWLTDAEAAALAAGLGARVASVREMGPGKHVFSHIEWHMQGYLLEADAFDPPEGYRFAGRRELAEELALPTAFRVYSGPLPVLLAADAVQGGEAHEN